MGKQSSTNPKSRPVWHGFRQPAAWTLAFLWAALSCMAQTTVPASAVPLILPAGLAYDAAGNLFFSESGRHLIRRVTPAGLLTTVAGTGTQGFAGDGGPATAALLDTPTALALDAVGDIFVADTHNHRIRRIDAGTGQISSVASSVNPAALAIDAAGNLFFADVSAHQISRLDAVTGTISTVAGTGIQGFSGDGGPAVAANLDTPTGLALSSAGDLLLADTHNHRIRRINASTGVITTVTASALLPRGLTLDASGNLLFADAALQQILQIAPNGAVSVIAGTSTQNFAGDGNPATAALLDSPQAVTLSTTGLVTLADTANGRIRQVDAAGIIHTLAGLGSGATSGLSLTAPSVVLYGTGTVTATLAASSASGTVTLFDASQATPVTVGTAALTANAASFSAASLPVGSHRLFATYSGDALHPSAQSAALSLSVTPVAVTATPASVSILYGQAVPVLSGTLVGVLPQDASSVSLSLSSSVKALSPPATYFITATLTGPAAGNYSLSAAAAGVTIAKAPATATLDTSRAPALSVQVASTTSGSPTGLVTLLDGGAPFASATLSAGSATLSGANLTPGSHTLTTSYAGDADFLAATSPSSLLVVAPPTLPDFTLAVSGPSSVTVAAGTAAQYSFAVTPTNGALASPLLLAASGLPFGATATFSPTYLPPSNGPAAFTLTIATPKASLAPVPSPYALALLLPFVLLLTRRRRRALMLLTAALLLGCGDRVNNTATTSATTTAYTITITATTTQSTGAALQHTANVTLNLQQ